MVSKKAKWGTGQVRLQIYLPADLQVDLERYISEQFSTDSRVTSAIVRKALEEFLERKGYRGGANVKSDQS